MWPHRGPDPPFDERAHSVLLHFSYERRRRGREPRGHATRRPHRPHRSCGGREDRFVGRERGSRFSHTRLLCGGDGTAEPIASRCERIGSWTVTRHRREGGEGERRPPAKSLHTTPAPLRPGEQHIHDRHWTQRHDSVHLCLARGLPEKHGKWIDSNGGGDQETVQNPGGSAADGSHRPHIRPCRHPCISK